MSPTTYSIDEKSFLWKLNRSCACATRLSNSRKVSVLELVESELRARSRILALRFCVCECAVISPFSQLMAIVQVTMRLNNEFPAPLPICKMYQHVFLLLRININAIEFNCVLLYMHLNRFAAITQYLWWAHRANCRRANSACPAHT